MKAWHERGAAYVFIDDDDVHLLHRNRQIITDQATASGLDVSILANKFSTVAVAELDENQLCVHIPAHNLPSRYYDPDQNDDGSIAIVPTVVIPIHRIEAEYTAIDTPINLFGEAGGVFVKYLSEEEKEAQELVTHKLVETFGQLLGNEDFNNSDVDVQGMAQMSPPEALGYLTGILVAQRGPREKGTPNAELTGYNDTLYKATDKNMR